MRATNYSSADDDVLKELYLMMYEQRLDGEQRVFVRGNRQVEAVAEECDRVGLQVRELHTGELETDEVDMVVLATGFRDLGPGPGQEPLPPLFLNGLCESTHGIGDSGSFSLLSLRAATIRDGLRKRAVVPA
jgi:L-ornithine N5-oxygenase